MDFNKKAYLMAIFGMVIYSIFISLAIITYAGGTMDTPTAPGYNFFENTFSDTGRLVAHNGESNLIAMIFFTIAYASISILFLPFYYMFPKVFEGSKGAKNTASLGSFLGILSSIFFIMVLFVPADVIRSLHMLLAIIAYILIFFMATSYSVALYLGNRLPVSYTYIFTVFSVFFFSMLLMKLIGILIDERMLLCTGQKLGRIANLLTFSILLYGLWNVET